jgi:hypothetical protein
MPCEGTMPAGSCASCPSDEYGRLFAIVSKGEAAGESERYSAFDPRLQRGNAELTRMREGQVVRIAQYHSITIVVVVVVVVGGQ